MQPAHSFFFRYCKVKVVLSSSLSDAGPPRQQLFYSRCNWMEECCVQTGTRAGLTLPLEGRLSDRRSPVAGVHRARAGGFRRSWRGTLQIVHHRCSCAAVQGAVPTTNAVLQTRPQGAGAADLTSVGPDFKSSIPAVRPACACPPRRRQPVACAPWLVAPAAAASLLAACCPACPL